MLKGDWRASTLWETSVSITLQDRPTASPSSPQRRRGGGGLRLAGAAVLAAVVVLGADRAMGLLPSLDNPLEEQVVDHSQGPALMLALSDLAEYRAARGSFQVMVDLERDTPYVPGFVKGERTTYLATGTVDGIVDFGSLGATAVQTEGRSVVITLPPPRLGEPALDLEQSQVVSRDRGLVDRVVGVLEDSPTSERDVALAAEEKLRAAAAESDIRARAQENTRSMLTGLAGSFGYTDVTVRFDADSGT
jgi:hypothetical protein